jgi:hypothetical protein
MPLSRLSVRHHSLARVLAAGSRVVDRVSVLPGEAARATVTLTRENWTAPNFVATWSVEWSLDGQAWSVLAAGGAAGGQTAGPLGVDAVSRVRVSLPSVGVASRRLRSTVTTSHAARLAVRVEAD